MKVVLILCSEGQASGFFDGLMIDFCGEGVDFSFLSLRLRLAAALREKKKRGLRVPHRPRSRLRQ